jgi:uncharacterized protein YciI
MAHFLVEYADTGDAQAREAHRGAHISYRKQLGARLALAGPLMGEDGKPSGSVVIIEAESRAEAELWALQDPYIVHGVLKLVSLRGYRIAAMNPPSKNSV